MSICIYNTQRDLTMLKPDKTAWLPGIYMTLLAGSLS